MGMPAQQESAPAELSYEEAKELVLDRARELLAEENRPRIDPAIIEGRTIEKDWGWVFYWNTALYLETGDLEHALVGSPPLCVDRKKGSVGTVANVEPLTREIKRYERKIGARPWWKVW
jgi:hypothetical protein